MMRQVHIHVRVAAGFCRTAGCALCTRFRADPWGGFLESSDSHGRVLQLALFGRNGALCILHPRCVTDTDLFVGHRDEVMILEAET